MSSSQSTTWDFFTEDNDVDSQLGQQSELPGFECRTLPGGTVTKTLSFQCKGHAFNPWSGN